MYSDWVAHEMLDSDLGDERLNKRLALLLQALSAQPTASLPQACGTRAATKAAYRFLSSNKVTPEAIREAHRAQVLEHARRAGRVLAIQDTTSLDFRTQPRMQGIGPTGTNGQLGLLVHSVLLASPTALPLGLLWQHVWARDEGERGKSKDSRKRDIQDKESLKWLSGLEAVEQTLPDTIPCVVVGDREADLYPLFAADRRKAVDLLVRAAYNRRVTEEAKLLHSALEQAPIAGTKTISVPAREGKPAREAILSVRFTSVTLKAPNYYPQTKPTLGLQAIEAFEATPPAGVAALRWVLLTTVAVTGFAQANECLQMYTCRWLIEQYHRTLKSGCQIEALQLETAERLHVALALYSIVACRLLWLTLQSRQQPDTPCTRVLADYEWQSLYATRHRTTQLPAEPPSLRQAVHWIAELGGFLGRTSDGEPGVQTLWRGLQRLNDIAATWQLIRQTYG